LESLRNTAGLVSLTLGGLQVLTKLYPIPHGSKLKPLLAKP